VVEGLLQTVRIALAASALGEVLVKSLAAEIDAICMDRRFYGYPREQLPPRELDRIREGSPRNFSPSTRRSAAELIGHLSGSTRTSARGRIIGTA
jgi:hypothetical protein